MTIVLDTNVLVSGLLNPSGMPGRLLDLIVAGHVVIAVDDRVTQEYRAVLRRPRFGFSPGDVSAVLDLIERTALHVHARPLAIHVADPGDQPFLEVAVESQADALVTGNPRHYADAARRVRVHLESPAAFVRLWRQKTRSTT